MLKRCPGCRRNRVFFGDLCARCAAIERNLKALGWRQHFQIAMYVQDEIKAAPLHLASGPLLRLYWN